MKRIFLSALMVSIIGFATAAAQTITPFQKGDRVAIVGNSITDGDIITRISGFIT